MPAKALKRQAELIARKFWGAFATANLEAAWRFYADKVTVRFYSHMLKKKYGVVTDDNVRTDVTVDREKLIAGYAKMLKEIGKEKWIKAYGAIDPKKISITFAAEADKPFPGVKVGDLILKIAPVEDEGLTFVFRAEKYGAYWIVIEKNDY